MNAITPTGSRFNPDQLALLRRTMMPGAPEDAFKLFIYQCERSGLDPFSRQIYAVKRWDGRELKDVWQTQTSIDGFRLIAERSGKYAGQLGPFWCGKDGEWRDVWLSKEPPAAARVGVLRHDFKEPCWGVARFDAYAQKKKGGELSPMWVNMADVMSAKCSEALALRKAFPQELSGLYTSDEMAQAVEDAPKANATPVQTKAPVADDPFEDQSVPEFTGWPEYIDIFKRDFLSAGTYLKARDYFKDQERNLHALREASPTAYADLKKWCETEGARLPKDPI